MKKTINVNIGGSAFTMDEDAHTALTFYLAQIKVRLSPAESAEVMEDVEMRIGALLSERLPGSFRVVDLSLVNEVMQIMGPASEFGEEPRSSGTYTNSSSSGSSRRGYEQAVDDRFYRSRDNRIFAGICGELSSRMGVDVSLVRIILVLLMLGSMSVLFWVYLIAWIVIPEEPIKPFNVNKEQK